MFFINAALNKEYPFFDNGRIVAVLENLKPQILLRKPFIAMKGPEALSDKSILTTLYFVFSE